MSFRKGTFHAVDQDGDPPDGWHERPGRRALEARDLGDPDHGPDRGVVTQHLPGRRGEFAGVFGPREANVEEAVVGNMGTMYRVRVGPYANAGEGQAACAKLKGSGLDCLVVAQ